MRKWEGGVEEESGGGRVGVGSEGREAKRAQLVVDATCEGVLQRCKTSVPRKPLPQDTGVAPSR